MECQECKQNSATVHLTKIVNDQVSEIHLCESCAWEKGDFGPDFSIQDMIASILNFDMAPSPEDRATRCETCGMTYRDFYKQGKLGCADCIRYFGEDFQQILHRVQGKLTHTGKIPQRIGGDVMLKRDIRELKESLQRKVIEEKFEEAALIRDQIRELEASLED